MKTKIMCAILAILVFILPMVIRDMVADSTQSISLFGYFLGGAIMGAFYNLFVGIFKE